MARKHVGLSCAKAAHSVRTPYLSLPEDESFLSFLHYSHGRFLLLTNLASGAQVALAPAARPFEPLRAYKKSHSLGWSK